MHGFFMKTLAERLKWLRQKYGFKSKSEAASYIGIKYGSYQGWEYGLSPGRKNAEKLAAFYKCSLSWLMTGEGEPYPNGDQDNHSPFAERDLAAPLYNKDTLPVSQEINIDEAIGKTYKVLKSGTPYAVALYLNIQQFSSALDTSIEISAYKEELAELRDEIADMKRQIDRLSAVPDTATAQEDSSELEKKIA
jgi:transcriptional regulator with XRE-family HTH domain